MELKYELSYFRSLWFRYDDGWKRRYCQVDGLLFLEAQKRIVILEAKIRHCVEAYFQLEEKYVPVVRHVFPAWDVATCEVVRWFDPAIAYPTAVALRKEVHLAEPGEFAVHILNKV